METNQTQGRESKLKVTAETFVIVWQMSETFEEVMQRTGLSQEAVASRYNYYTKNGIPLRQLVRIEPPQKKRLDWATLHSLAEKYVPSQSK